MLLRFFGESTTEEIIQ